uniref:Uncharacterized protein n=1 Tax=Fagus sylvatica TaxID=28930 RepID=A0A2N9EEK1_FAGSY
MRVSMARASQLLRAAHHLHDRASMAGPNSLSLKPDLKIKT